MLSTTIEIEAGHGVAEAYVTRPDESAHPGVLLYMDAFGLRPRIYEMADRIAAWGFVVMAPNTFYRHGTVEDLAAQGDLSDPTYRDEFIAGAMGRVRSLGSGLATADVGEYVDRLLELPEVSGDGVGVTGYCMGSAMALRTAGARPDQVKAAAGFHGSNLATDAPDSPHLVAKNARARLYLGHADNDRSMPLEKIEILEKAFDAAGLLYTSEVYPDAPHGFTMSDMASYRADADERHFKTLESLLRESLTP
ncbi:dienelactone hydrolase family protein [Nocardia sp. 348MFTsu5.1]|uniref:dienelactone hydrolase family protein n=1 Tax=Nocardia sp. 348MFTsu5.1 TaxID=1172185 RepID=UPI000370455F|nr:dienelactone hydrolase family protein [Nocardia sp. 348MFTsu5.1]